MYLRVRWKGRETGRNKSAWTDWAKIYSFLKSYIKIGVCQATLCSFFYNCKYDLITSWLPVSRFGGRNQFYPGARIDSLPFCHIWYKFLKLSSINGSIKHHDLKGPAQLVFLYQLNYTALLFVDQENQHFVEFCGWGNKVVLKRKGCD